MLSRPDGVSKRVMILVNDASKRADRRYNKRWPGDSVPQAILAGSLPIDRIGLGHKTGVARKTTAVEFSTHARPQGWARVSISRPIVGLADSGTENRTRVLTSYRTLVRVVSDCGITSHSTMLILRTERGGPDRLALDRDRRRALSRPNLEPMLLVPLGCRRARRSDGSSEGCGSVSWDCPRTVLGRVSECQ